MTIFVRIMIARHIFSKKKIIFLFWLVRSCLYIHKEKYVDGEERERATRYSDDIYKEIYVYI